MNPERAAPGHCANDQRTGLPSLLRAQHLLQGRWDCLTPTQGLLTAFVRVTAPSAAQGRTTELLCGVQVPLRGCSASGCLQLLPSLTQKVLLAGLSSRASKSPVPSAIAPVKLAPGSRSCAPVHGSAGLSHSSLPAQTGIMETQNTESLQGLSQPPAHPLFPPCGTLSTRLAGSLLEVLELNGK